MTKNIDVTTSCKFYIIYGRNHSNASINSKVFNSKFTYYRRFVAKNFVVDTEKKKSRNTTIEKNDDFFRRL